MIHVPPDAFILTPAFAKMVCEPAWRWAKREKPFETYDLFYVWSGQGNVVRNGTAYDVQKGSCFLFRPGDVTSAEHDPQKPLTLTYIHFQIRQSPKVIPVPYRDLKESVVDFETLLSRYVRLFLVKTYGAEEEAKLILKQLMIMLLREEHWAEQQPQKAHSHQLNEAIQEVANFVRLHAGVQHRIEDLAGRARLSPRYFSAKFKEIMGETVQSFIIKARIERAEHLLYYAGMSVSDVADALGYRDVFFFSRQFKQHTGKSPSEIR